MEARIMIKDPMEAERVYHEFARWMLYYWGVPGREITSYGPLSIGVEALEKIRGEESNPDIEVKEDIFGIVTLTWRGIFTNGRMISMSLYPEGGGCLRARTGTGKPSRFFYSLHALRKYLPELVNFEEEDN